MTRYADLATLRRNMSPDVVVVADARPTSAAAELAALLRNSPDVGIADISGLNVTPAVAVDDAKIDASIRSAGEEIGAAIRNAGALGVDVPNPLAAKFEHLWQTWQGPELVKEYRFHPHRRWRADYFEPVSRTIIELEGGVWSDGRHSRGGGGFLADIEKYNAASMMGITVLRLGTGQVDHQHVTEIIDWLRKGVRNG